MDPRVVWSVKVCGFRNRQLYDQRTLELCHALLDQTMYHHNHDQQQRLNAVHIVRVSYVATSVREITYERQVICLESGAEWDS